MAIYDLLAPSPMAAAVSLREQEIVLLRRSD
jgi:hypothetical protein